MTQTIISMPSSHTSPSRGLSEAKPRIVASDDAPADSDEPEPEPQPITVSLDVPADDIDPDAPGYLAAALARVAEQACIAIDSLSIVIVDDAAIADLHQRFLNVDGTTDVITFDLSEATAGVDHDPASGGVDGELYLCLDEARRRAAEFGHPVADELLLYAVHGLLHLVGYDDHDPEDHRIMHAKEDELLTAIGVGPVFSRREGRGS